MKNEKYLFLFNISPFFIIKFIILFFYEKNILYLFIVFIFLIIFFICFNILFIISKKFYEEYNLIKAKKVCNYNINYIFIFLYLTSIINNSIIFTIFTIITCIFSIKNISCIIYLFFPCYKIKIFFLEKKYFLAIIPLHLVNYFNKKLERNELIFINKYILITNNIIYFL